MVSTSQTPLVSVIIPTYNRRSVLERAMNSVLTQTYSSFELIIIDDGSTDGTSDWVKSLYHSHKINKNIHLFTTENRGVSAARNVGIHQAKGEWIAFLDSDDEWLPKKLELQLALANNHPEFPLIHGEEIWVRNGVRVNQMKKHQKFGGQIFLKCLPLCVISPSASLIRRDLLQKLGGFRQDYPVCEDYELWLRITSKHAIGFVSDPVIIKYGGHEDQLSHRFFAMDYWRVKALKNILDLDGDDHNISLLSEWRLEVMSEILRKGEILLKGYRKHQNYEHYQEIEKILSLYRIY